MSNILDKLKKCLAEHIAQKEDEALFSIISDASVCFKLWDEKKNKYFRLCAKRDLGGNWRIQ